LGQQLDVLARWNLLRADKTGNYFEMHSLVRQFALENLDDSDDVHLRPAKHCASLSEDIEHLSYQDPDRMVVGLQLF